MSPDTSFADGKKRTVDCLLIQRLREGDPCAFADAYDNYSRPIYGLILHMVGDAELAQDLLQEVFLKLWISAARLEEGATALGPWLVTIARDHVLDYLKSRENRSAMKSTALDLRKLPQHVRLPEHDFVFDERVGMLRSGLDRLDVRQRRVLEWAYFEGLTQTKMAEVLNLPLGTVKSCVRTALRNLKKHLEQGEP